MSSDDLEEKAEIRGELAPWARRDPATWATARAQPIGAASSLPVFRRMELDQAVRVECTYGRDVDVLAADHAERRVDELARYVGSVIAQREPDRLTEQRVAGEDRDGLAELRVTARLATAQVVVVERRRSS